MENELNIQLNKIENKLNKEDKFQKILITTLVIALVINIVIFFGGFIFRNNPTHCQFLFQSNGNFQPYILGAVTFTSIIALIEIPIFIISFIHEKKLEKDKIQIIPEDDNEVEEPLEKEDEEIEKNEEKHELPFLTTNLGIDYQILQDDNQLMFVSKKKIKL